MTEEIINPQLLEQIIRQRIFLVEETPDGRPSISFSSHLGPLNSEKPIIHTPLQQLFSFYDIWGGFLPPMPEEIKREFEPVRFQQDEGLYIVPELTGRPIDLFDSLQFGKVADRYNSIIEKAKRVKLLGAMVLPSVYDVILYLIAKKFNGILEVYDISPVPIRIGQTYQELNLLPEIQVVFIHKSALEIGNDNQADLIISDVLGYYLDPEEYKQLTKAIEINLREGGIWLTRELVEPEMQAPACKRSVNDNFTKKMTGFNDFIYNLFGFRLEEDVLEKFEAERWTLVPQYPRRTEQEYLSAVPAGNLSLDVRIPVTSRNLLNDQIRRIFVTFVFKKE